MRIWTNPNEKHEVEGQCEMANDRIEDKFVNALCELFAQKLDINWKQREIFVALIKSSIQQEVNKLLKQFLHHELTIIGDTLNQIYEIDENVCYDFATHAKLSDHLSAIEQKLNVTKEGDDKVANSNSC